MAAVLYDKAARGEAQISHKPLVAERSGAPPTEIPRKFPYQSYFDSSLLDRAILASSAIEQIITSTRSVEDLGGHAIGLHPASETPVVVQLKTSAMSFTGAPILLKPGQIITPAGLPPGERQGGGFIGFTWGLPFGWLGGGLARLVVFHTLEAQAFWTGNPEVIFHRVRIPIYQPSRLDSGDINNARNNWPSRFPWTQAPAGQGGVGTIGVEPTRVLMALRGISPLAAPVDMRLIYQGTNEFARSSTDAAVLTTPLYEDITWPSWTATGTSGNLATQNPVLVLNSAIARLGADDGGIAAVDLSGSSALNNGYIDVVRYGRL